MNFFKSLLKAFEVAFLGAWHDAWPPLGLALVVHHTERPWRAVVRRRAAPGAVLQDVAGGHRRARWTALETKHSKRPFKAIDNIICNVISYNIISYHIISYHII